MRPEDDDLLMTFGKISKLMPGILYDFVIGTLTPGRQHEFGEILIDLGELLVKNAEESEQSGQPTIIESPGHPVEQSREQIEGSPS